MSIEKRTDTRVRNYACIVYPDSVNLPENWKDIISNEHVPCFISPLHDKDIDPQNQPKKPHYHVLVMYEGKKSLEQVEKFFTSFGGVGVETVQSIRGYSRYLCHLDNPEKAQYSIDDISCLGGADYSSCIGLPTDKYKAIREMMAYCVENNIFSYSELLEYASVNHFDWFRVLCDNGTVVMKEYLKSRSWTRLHDLERE